MDDENLLTTRDWLAVERTKLANERTFLAHFRTFLVIISTGITILKIELFSELKSYGFVLIIISAIILCIGVFRFFMVRRNIKKHYELTLK